jgi:WD40 repeat protein
MKKVFFVLILLLAGAGLSFAQSTNFGKNKVQYKEFHWHYIQSAHFDIYYYEGGYELAQFCAEIAESSLTSIEASIRYDITQRISILVYNSHNDFQQTNAVGEYLPEGVGGVTELFKNRVVVPFEGNYELFRHVIHHELVHAVLNDMYAGGSYQSLLTGGGIMIPSWMNEGLAEYESLGGLDIETDMFMRDATLADAVPSLSRLGGYVQYRVGQTMYWYISEKYGPEKVAELLQRIRTSRSPELAYKSTFGIGLGEFSDKFIDFLKKQYYPDISRFDDPANFAEVLADHKALGNFYNSSPELSPKGDYIAFISDRDNYYDIFIQSVAKPSDIHKIVSGGGAQSGFEELHLLTPGLTWSPDEKHLALAAKAGKYDIVHIIDVESGDYDVQPLPLFELDAIQQVKWSPDGRSLALIAYKDGASDIYLYDFDSKNLTNLTKDAFADQDIEWSPDSKSLFFASDRGDHVTPGQFPPKGLEQSKIEVRQKDIYRLDIAANTITRLTNTPGADETKPAVSKDKKTLFFISNLNGINNIFAANIDGTSARPLTNSVAKIDQISTCDDGSKLVFSAIRKGGYNMYLMRNPLDRNLDSLPTTKFRADKAAELALKDSAIKRINNPNRSEVGGADSTVGYGDVAIDLHNYVFSNNPYDNDRSKYDYRPKQKLQAITNYKDSSGDYISRDYKVIFTPDIILGTAGYNGYYGLQGSAQLLFSDELGNHQLYFATNFLLDLKNSDYVLMYNNLQGRVNYGLQAFHSARFLYTSPDPGYENYGYFISRFTEYGLTGWTSYPLSRFDRLDINLSTLVLEKDQVDDQQGISTDNIPTKRKFAITPGIGYVHDDVLWSYFYPKAGTRYNLSLSASPKFSNNTLGFFTPQFDFRHYFRIIGDMTFVARLSGAASFGPTPQKFFLGGVDGWINRYFSSTTYPLSEPQDFAFYASGTPLRGFPYNQEVGTKYGLMNLALRFPFPILVTGLPLALISEAFVDAGTAWNDNVYLLQRNASGGWTTKDLLLSSGIGFRTYLFGFYIKMDIAWTTTIDHWAEPQYIFSLGEDF